MMKEEYPLLGGTPSKRKTVLLIVILSVVLVFITAVTTSLIWSVSRKSSTNNPNNPEEPLVCPATNFPLGYNSFYNPKPTPPVTSPLIVIKNATVFTGTGTILAGYDLALENGVITQIGLNLPTTNAQVFNVQGRYVTPGLVDMHSHIGVYAYPEDARANSDGNELTNPAFPYIRALDAINPSDPAIPSIRSGGVTTSLVLPGSGNVMGGESATVKLKGVKISEILIPNAPRTLKMACGENPKNVYGGKGQLPSTRMGIAWKFREMFFKAAQLKQLQDQWDCLNGKAETSDPRPEDLTLEPLVGVLKGNVRLNVHCYRVQDIEMMVRTSKEFNFSIAAFHHALEAWMIPEALRDNGIVAATFADHWGFKWEGYYGSTQGPVVLRKAGVNVALKSDHPVIFAKWLMYEAAKSHHYGLSEADAIASVTRVPATAIGLGDKIGTLEVGKQADVVVWDRYPLDIGATADKVFIDGNLIDNFNLPSVPHQVLSQANLTYSGVSACGVSASYVVKGVTVYTMNGANDVIDAATIRVDDGIVTCIGNCSEAGTTATYTLTGGSVIPGIISVGSHVGQFEIDQESGTYDGNAGSDIASTIRASDGIRFHILENKKMKAAASAGVNAIFTFPQGSSLINGIGAAFYTRGRFVDDALVNERLSLHGLVGNNAKKSGLSNSISGQIAQLRNLFLTGNTTSPYSDVLAGSIPFVVHVDSADQINTLLRLKKEVNIPRMIILGGAEAHLLADRLASAGVGVILTARAPPNGYETYQSVPNAVALLNQAGVAVGLTIEDSNDIRNLIWEAGFAFTQGVDRLTSIATVTKTPASLFGLNSSGVGSISVGQTANFVAFSSDPLSIQSHVKLVALSQTVECSPQQY